MPRFIASQLCLLAMEVGFIGAIWGFLHIFLSALRIKYSILIVVVLCTFL